MTRNRQRLMMTMTLQAGALRRALIAAAVAALLALSAVPASACDELTHPGPVPATGITVDADTALQPGQGVLVEWGGQWWSGEVLWADGPQVRIHYLGWESSWDEVVPRSRLQAWRDEG